VVAKTVENPGPLHVALQKKVQGISLESLEKRPGKGDPCPEIVGSQEKTGLTQILFDDLWRSPKKILGMKQISCFGTLLGTPSRRPKLVGISSIVDRHDKREK
jgi:hypothetical protein